MSKSNQNGRALEFAYLQVFEAQLSATQSVIVQHNSSFEASKTAWYATEDNMKLFVRAEEKKARLERIALKR